MRKVMAAVVAAVVLTETCGPSFAFDPSAIAQGRQPARGAIAAAYVRLPLGVTGAEDRMAYGLAITAPTPGHYGAFPLSMAQTPKLLDLRFSGAVPDSLSVTGRLAWARDSQHLPDGGEFQFVAELANIALGLAGTALAVYGVYMLVKKECPAISTTNGACLSIGN